MQLKNRVVTFTHGCSMAIKNIIPTCVVTWFHSVKKTNIIIWLRPSHPSQSAEWVNSTFNCCKAACEHRPCMCRTQRLWTPLSNLMVTIATVATSRRLMRAINNNVFQLQQNLRKGKAECTERKPRL